MKKIGLIIVMTGLLLMMGCSPKITVAKSQPPADFGRGRLDTLPVYNQDSDNPFKVDLRGYDVSQLDITDRLNDLSYADFDSKTKWSQELPKGFDPNEIMEFGKRPGLRIKELHDLGITGKGIGIAVIDQGLLTNHIEYGDRLKMYQEIDCIDRQAAMHASAVLSIAGGKTVGVAPEADLYHIGTKFYDFNKEEAEPNALGAAKSIQTLLKVNDQLPEEEKIRVISLSIGYEPESKGYEAFIDAVEEAKKENIFIVSSNLEAMYGFSFYGLGREISDDPEDFSLRTPALYWKDRFFQGEFDEKNILWLPTDSRTVASPTGEEDYVFYREGGYSWGLPYIAGLYALGCQVKPDLTPEIFWAKALETGDTVEIEKDVKLYTLKKVVNPVKLIQTLEGLK